MVFSSSLFLLYFFPVFFILYFIIADKYKNLFILAGSLFFYMWGAPKFVAVIVASIIVDFILSKKIYNSENQRKRKIWLVFSVCLNVSVLLYFKYSNFFIDNLNEILKDFGYKDVEWTKVALPIGISFFTFHELSYIIDVYRGVNMPMKRIWDYAVYILLFPQLIAGPIIRYKEIANQIIDRKAQETADNKLYGFLRFIIGLSKKVLIANTLAAVADEIFAINSSELSTGTAWLGIIAYSFQIYFDFSGYSDMAIGMARMMGFYFPENFNNPYIARNITEFWKRWHMSLSRWMRDYLYIPLGGNQVKTKAHLFFNLWLVFLISGFWHGASWNFIVWGAFHGLFLILDRIFLIKLFERAGRIPSIIFTFIIVLIGWVFFRADTLTQALEFIKTMFAFNFSTDNIFIETKVWAILIIAFVFTYSALFENVEKMQESFINAGLSLRAKTALALVCFVFLIISTSSVVSSEYNPFIYFRF